MRAAVAGVLLLAACVAGDLLVEKTSDMQLVMRGGAGFEFHLLNSAKGFRIGVAKPNGDKKFYIVDLQLKSFVESLPDGGAEVARASGDVSTWGVACSGCAPAGTKGKHVQDVNVTFTLPLVDPAGAPLGDFAQLNASMDLVTEENGRSLTLAEETYFVPKDNVKLTFTVDWPGRGPAGANNSYVALFEAGWVLPKSVGDLLDAGAAVSSKALNVRNAKDLIEITDNCAKADLLFKFDVCWPSKYERLFDPPSTFANVDVDVEILDGNKGTNIIMNFPGFGSSATRNRIIFDPDMRIENGQLSDGFKLRDLIITLCVIVFVCCAGCIALCVFCCIRARKGKKEDYAM